VRGCRGHAVRRCGATNAAGLGKRERCKEEESTVDECGRAINGRIKKEKGGGRQWLGWCADGVRAARGRLSGPAVNKFCTCVTYSGRLHPGRCACTGSCGSPSGPARSLCHPSRHMTSRARRCASCRRAAAERRPARRRIHGFMPSRALRRCGRRRACCRSRWLRVSQLEWLRFGSVEYRICSLARSTSSCKLAPSARADPRRLEACFRAGSATPSSNSRGHPSPSDRAARRIRRLSL
jgi:hypothetical protein